MSTDNFVPIVNCRYYLITVEGNIDPSWSDWFCGMQIVSIREIKDLNVTILSGVVHDQAALRGLLNLLWDMNHVLLSIQQVNFAQK